MTDAGMASVKEVWRYPVKSMQGERLDQAEITAGGVVGDRAYALVDRSTGKVVSAKSVRLFGGLLGFQAAFVEPPRPGGEPSPVRITFPDGTSVTSDSGDAERLLSTFFRRDVALARVAPDDFTIDQYHPDVEGADPAGHRDTVVEARLGAALFAQIGAPSPVPQGSFFDVFPVSVLTTSTLTRLDELQHGSRFDARRFRMNVIVETGDAGFVENAWVGKAVAVGGDVRLQIALPDPRCVMTTLAQDDLPADTDVLRALVKHNRLDLGPLGHYPCAGVYAVVGAPGTIRTGDRVSIT
ncbi:MAG TPA: MOSC N-terminal beta barrel domain-containing protein [Dehalococcoidia bacterium]|nr:MOSC N-terminal beta barrel domain-containing protein [Dehalococcoidia bacterium]